MIFYGKDNKKYKVNDYETHKGGEGELFETKDGKFLVKIYEQPSKKRKKKTEVMVDVAKSWDKTFLEYVAPPVDIVFADLQRKQFAGFVMKKKSGKIAPLTAVYDREYSAGIKYKEKIIAAKNICTLVYLAHKNGVVIGDFNHKNIGVHTENTHKRGILDLFDNDSFQIVKDGKVYKCTVGIPTEMAPEIARKLAAEKTDLEHVSAVVYDKYTDYYTMALHIFHLLMNGAHPFQAKVEGGKLQPSANVHFTDVIESSKQGRFLFANPLPGLVPPQFAFSFSILSPRLQSLFKRAFVDGLRNPEQRPTPEEFFAALEEYQGGMVKARCGKRDHIHYKTYHGECEMCRAESTLRKKPA